MVVNSLGPDMVVHLDSQGFYVNRWPHPEEKPIAEFPWTFDIIPSFIGQSNAFFSVADICWAYGILRMVLTLAISDLVNQTDWILNIESIGRGWWIFKEAVV